MKMIYALAIGLLAAATSLSGAVSAEPATPCTEANDGALETVPVDGPSGPGFEFYYCNAGYGWTLIGSCDATSCSEL